jgi:AcrR family transcriptional regulator
MTSGHPVLKGRSHGVERRSRARRGEGGRLRHELVAAASRLLRDTGDLSAISLRGVAREVGVAPTSVYLHFPDLDSLVTAVRKQRFADLIEAMEDAAEQAGRDPVTRVRAGAHAYVRFGLENAGHYRVLFQSLPAYPAEHVAGFPGDATFVRVATDVGAALGPDADGDEAALVTTQLWTALHGLVTLRTARVWFPWPVAEQQVDDLVRRLLGQVWRPPSGRR